MAVYNELNKGKIFLGKLRYGGDLLEELTSVCKANDIKLGRLEALGAVQKACIGFYDQVKREYKYFELEDRLEITNLIGNVSLKDGEPIVHAHITFADNTGRAFGGHLAAGTIIFATEFLIETLDGPQYNRGYDEQTSLPLWNM